MGYYASVRGAELKISDKEGLLSFLRKETSLLKGSWDDEGDELFDRLADCLPVSDLYNVREDGTIELYSYEKYRATWWMDFAPFFEGYIEWYGEDGTIWRDCFSGGSMTTIYPEITWPLMEKIKIKA